RERKLKGSERRMIAWQLKAWQTASATVAVAALAACGQSGNAPEDATGETPATELAAAGGEAGEAAVGEAGGEHGEAGVASAYTALAGYQLMLLRLNHLKGFVMAAHAIAQRSPNEAAVLLLQGLFEVYYPAVG